ncbi:hypothetical protein EON65_25295 [archaeon]|nr:MAG: hypothetical protein EON65_25295 [archaeon]
MEEQKDQTPTPVAPTAELDRKTTFANEPGFARKSTFTRAFTFDNAYIRDGIQQPIDKLTRTITDIAERFDPDAKFTKAVISDYTQVANEGNEGDIPFPEPFANTFNFWKVTFLTVLLAILMGILSAAFMNFTDEAS